VRWVLLIFVCVSRLVLAQDARLDALRSSLIAIRHEEKNDVRGATPQLTVVKHQLRDWIESRLTQLPQRGDAEAFVRPLNTELHAAGLVCEYEPGKLPCPEWYDMGFIEDVRIQPNTGFLIVQTGVGIECGYDESAYMYRWSGEGWNRVWQSEQNTYIKGKYFPQAFAAIRLSPFNRDNDYLVLTLGYETWCASNWHDVYYRVFRLGPDLLAPPLVEGSSWAFYPQNVQGSIGRNDVLIEFTVAGGNHSREAVRHYVIDDRKVQRVDPLALRPPDFIEEWMNSHWKDAVHWSESTNRGLMLDWHSRLNKEKGCCQLIFPTMHCPKSPDLWQVGMDFSAPPTPIGQAPKSSVYFLVRWRPPYQFTMVQAKDSPFPGCTEEDRKADEEHRTLFPH
jgi:hypothetical protein